MISRTLTIAIPTYNGGENLIEAVQSCRHIGLPSEQFEILVVDNCSTDQSILKAKKLKESLSNLRFEKNPQNIGRIENWNRCLELVDTPFVIFLFSNDLISERNQIPLLLNEMLADRTISLGVGQHISHSISAQAHTIVLNKVKSHEFVGLCRAKDYIFSRTESGKNPFVPLQKNIINMRIVRKYRIRFDPKIPISGDGLFLTQCAHKTNSAYFSDRPLFIHRFDAPDRMHGKIRLNDIVSERLSVFFKIKKLFPNINLEKAFSYSKIMEYLALSIFRTTDLQSAWMELGSGFRNIFCAISRSQSKSLLLFHLCMQIIRLPIKNRFLLHSRKKSA